MGFFLTILLFVFCLYLAIRLIAYFVNRYTKKTISDMDRMSALMACIAASFGYLIFLIATREVGLKEALLVNNILASLSLTRRLYAGLIFGGYTLMAGGGLCVIPFFIMKGRLQGRFNLSEDDISQIYSWIFLSSLASVMTLILFTLYFGAKYS